MLIRPRIVLTMGLACVMASSATAAEFHVAIDGNDANDGSKPTPFKTITCAAKIAQHGDTITIHAGTYREWVNPPRGGTSDTCRIIYQAASGEKVTITGSERIKGWEKVAGDTWKVVVSKSFFGAFNPYAETIHGDWFLPNGRIHHRGCVYLDGEWMDEARDLNEVMKPAGKLPLWFAKVDGDTDTTIYAQFPHVNPNEAQVEINVRPTIFTPEKTNINFITVRGFTIRNGASPWVSPSEGQTGLITAYWCKGWIIENNEVCYSKCAGITLGKNHDAGDGKNYGTGGFYQTIKDAQTVNGWSKANIGSHIVRNNHIHDCEEAGIDGSFGCSYSQVIGNEIHDIYVRRVYDGCEMAGIKFHGAVDVLIKDNHVYRAFRGIWLDWMAQGAQIVGNLFHDNDQLDVDFEVCHGPALIANNVLASDRFLALEVNAQSGAYVHNLFVGLVDDCNGDGRSTPYFKPHTTETAGMIAANRGDSHYRNNLFISKKCAFERCADASLPMFMDGNVFLHGALPSKLEANPMVVPGFDPQIKVVQKQGGWYLDFAVDTQWAKNQSRKLVTTEVLGRAKIPDQGFTKPDGTPLKIDTDYFGSQRNSQNPFPGPFELVKDGKQEIKVWPKD